MEEAVQMASSDKRTCGLLFTTSVPSRISIVQSARTLFYQYLVTTAYELVTWHRAPILGSLEHLYAESGLWVFDFTEGEGETQEFFSTGNMQCADIYYLRGTLRNLLVVVTHCGLCALTRLIVRTLEIVRLKEFIKRIIRRSA
jgi:hypothetical protein